ncbi:MAG: alpha/beta hydrolase, partial [Myxococcota bacterium]
LDYASDLEALSEALEVEQFHIFAHGFGALVAYEYTRRNPERVAGLILVGAWSPLYTQTEDGYDRFDERIAFNQPPSGTAVPNPIPENTATDCRPELLATLPVRFIEVDRQSFPPEIEAITCSNVAKLSTEGELTSLRPDYADVAANFAGRVMYIDGSGNSISIEGVANLFNIDDLEFNIALPGSGFFAWADDPNVRAAFFEDHMTTYFTSL